MYEVCEYRRATIDGREIGSLARASLRRGAISSILISAASVLRGLPLFFASRPKTPLRVLCVIAFDSLHWLNTSRRLPATKLKLLAALLDFCASANAVFDGKEICRRELRAAWRLLEQGGVRSTVTRFLLRLQAIERNRPTPGSGESSFHEVKSYRESVVRMLLELAAEIAAAGNRLDENILSVYRADDLEILFRIVMQCQIIDDVLDYSKDSAAGLPSFLTASESLPRSLAQTRRASLEYAEDRNLSQAADLFPLRLVLWLVAACAKRAIIWAPLRVARGRAKQKHVAESWSATCSVELDF